MHIGTQVVFIVDDQDCVRLLCASISGTHNICSNNLLKMMSQLLKSCTNKEKKNGSRFEDNLITYKTFQGALVKKKNGSFMAARNEDR